MYLIRVAQPGEHGFHKPKVEGSKPSYDSFLGPFSHTAVNFSCPVGSLFLWILPGLCTSEPWFSWRILPRYEDANSYLTSSSHTRLVVLTLFGFALLLSAEHTIASYKNSPEEIFSVFICSFPGFFAARSQYLGPDLAWR
jgi:hypothetical protein